MAGCLQVLILTFVVYLRSRGNNFTLIFELMGDNTLSFIVKPPLYHNLIPRLILTPGYNPRKKVIVIVF
jgi:hypothetical protein